MTNSCRHCGATLRDTFVDLGMSPLSNSFIRIENNGNLEQYYPLHAFVCGDSTLVQLLEFEAPQTIFRDYLYFSSYSPSLLADCERYADDVIGRLGLNEHSHVVEIASNDGYLLQYFVRRAILVLGIEPAKNVAAVARDKRAGQRIVGYGAPAKGKTVLYYCGIGPEFIDFTIDRNPHKQNHLLPGSRIPIRDPQAIFAAQPDLVSILPWNPRDEIMAQMSDIRRLGGRFVVAIPELEIIA